MGYAIRTSDHRFVEWRNFATGEVAARELYDHRSDPKEKKNLIDDAAEGLVTQLTDLLLKTHPREKLVMVPKIHSSSAADRMKVGLTFTNQSDTTALLNYIRPDGRRAWKLRGVRRLKPGKKMTFLNAKIGDVYIAESEDGKIYEIHSPSFPAKTVIL